MPLSLLLQRASIVAALLTLAALVGANALL